jgi:hypothetical protein
MISKYEKEVTKIMKDMWFNINVLEHDYGIEYDGYLTPVLKFTIQCIANKYKIDLGLRKD